MPAKKAYRPSYPPVFAVLDQVKREQEKQLEDLTGLRSNQSSTGDSSRQPGAGSASPIQKKPGA